MDTESFGRDVVGMFDAKIAELEEQLAALRDLRSMTAARLGVIAVVVPETRPLPQPKNGEKLILGPTRPLAIPEKRTKADLVAETLEQFGMPVKVPRLIDALEGEEDFQGSTREQMFNSLYTALSRSKHSDGSPRFHQVEKATWWFADRPIPGR